MVDISDRAAVRLREELINKCFELGIGFRMLVNVDEHGRRTLSIKLARQQKRDEVIEASGVRIFLDPASMARISKHQLDYQDEPNSGFFLRTMQETKVR